MRSLTHTSRALPLVAVLVASTVACIGSNGTGSGPTSGTGGGNGNPGSGGGNGNGTGGNNTGTGTGGNGVIHHGTGGMTVTGGGGSMNPTGSGGGPPPAGTGGMMSMKMHCPDNTSYAPSHSPGYPAADHMANMAMAMTKAQAMNLTAKANQMRGVNGGTAMSTNYADILRSVDDTTNGVRGYLYRDGPRGVNMDAGTCNTGRDSPSPCSSVALHGTSTVFPTAVARAASWDVDLEYKIGQALGDEMVAAQQTMLLVPTVNALRHPLWGRSQETYGEDSYLLGRFGTGLVAGVQEYVAACVKHFAANNIEKNRAMQNASLDAQTLRETYGRHFDMIVNDGGVGCVMAAYNAINNTKSTQNMELLTNLLRSEFGFQGLVLSDWWAMPGGQDPGLATSDRLTNAQTALTAGLDLELPWSLNYSALDSSSNITDSMLLPHVVRILEQKIRFKSISMTGTPGLKASTSTFSGGSISNSSHVDLSERAAQEGMVLLKNCPMSNKACTTSDDPARVLPINKKDGSIKTIAVVGASFNYAQQGNPPSGPGINNASTDRNGGMINFATDPRIGDVGSSRAWYDTSKAIGPFAGIQMAAGSGITVMNATTSGSDISAAMTAAGKADFVVVVAGLTPWDEGEEYNGSADRINFNLDEGGTKDLGRGYATVQTSLINAVAGLGKPMVVVLEAGSVINMPWLDQVPAVVDAWYSGMVGGKAIGKLLFADPAGCTDSDGNSGKPCNFGGKLPITWGTDETQYPTFSNGTNNTMDYYIGYRRFDQMGMTPKFPFGYGLSYTKFEYSNLVVPCSDVTKNGIIQATVDVKNTGTMAGDEVVQAYVSFPTTSNPRRSVKELKAFFRVTLVPGDTATVPITIRAEDLKYYDMGSSSWQVQTGTYTVKVGRSSADLPLMDTFQIN